MDADKVGFPIPATQRVNVCWGNSNYAIQLATCQANDALREADEWFAENQHFFHLNKFPPYRRFIPADGYTVVDYGSYVNFLYLIPVNI